MLDCSGRLAVLKLSNSNQIYRRYDRSTVSTGSRTRCLDNHCRALDKADAALNSAERLKPTYRQSLALSYFRLARNYFDLDRNNEDVMTIVPALEPGFCPQESPLYNAAQHCLGLTTAERLASWKRQLLSR